MIKKLLSKIKKGNKNTQVLPVQAVVFNKNYLESMRESHKFEYEMYKDSGVGQVYKDILDLSELLEMMAPTKK